MKSSLRVVVDTNVLVSGLFDITDSPSSQILKMILTRKIIFVTSLTILEEIKEVIRRPRIIKLTKMTEAEQADFIAILKKRSDITPGRQLTTTVGRDIKDDKFLACGKEGKADYIVTGDEDLLIIKMFEGIQIVTPRKFLKILGN